METTGEILLFPEDGHPNTSPHAKRRHHKGYFLSEKAKVTEADGSESNLTARGHPGSLAELWRYSKRITGA